MAAVKLASERVHQYVQLLDCVAETCVKLEALESLLAYQDNLEGVNPAGLAGLIELVRLDLDSYINKN